MYQIQPDKFLIHNSLEQEDAISPLLECVTGKVQENLEGLQQKRAHQLVVYAYSVKLLDKNINNTKTNKYTG